MGRHALLSASSSKRWLSCTPSARLEEQFQDEPGGSVYAEEGTAAHALAEHKLKKALKRRSKRPVSDYHCDEMEECTDGYVAFAMEQVELARQECKDPIVYVRLAENRLVFPVTAHDTVHDAVHAGVHELVQCRIFFQSNPSFRGVVAYLCFGGIASGKRKKPENHLVASDIF